MKKVNKSVARKMFNAGEVIHIVPCKANPDSMWFRDSMIVISKLRADNFDSIVAKFEYYNCNNGLGRRAAYYI